MGVYNLPEKQKRALAPGRPSPTSGHSVDGVVGHHHGFVEGFLRVNGKFMVLMVVDCFSKAVHFIPLGHPYTATTVARAFFNNVVRLHGILNSIVSNRDPIFTSNF
jgi:hypothetical protein